MESIACPLCNGTKDKVLFYRKDLTYGVTDHAFRVVKCRDCGLAYVNPRPDLMEIGAYYPEAFYRTTLSAEELMRNQGEALLLKLQHLPLMSPGCVLDIGCSRGEFLAVMKHMGWETHGVEFSPKAVNPFSLDIFHGQLAEAAFPDSYFDLVTMWAVLEHVHQPLPLLREVRRILRPGGKLKLLVTNMRSLPGRLMRVDDIPRHLILFSPPSLIRMLREAGFTDVTLNFDARLYGSTHRTLLIFLYKMFRGGG